MVYSCTEMDILVAETISKLINEGHRINLMNFNPKNISHKYIYEICLIINQFSQHKIVLQMNWFKFQLFKLKHQYVKMERLSPFEHVTHGSQINIEQFIAELLSKFSYNNSIIKQTYNEYYKKG